MRHTFIACGVSCLVLWGTMSLVRADPMLYYSQNTANGAAEADGYEYFAGYGYLRYRDSTNLTVELTAVTETSGITMFCGLDAVDMGGGTTRLYYTENYTSYPVSSYHNYRKMIKSMDWNGTSWSAATEIVALADETNSKFCSVTVGDFDNDGTLDMYYTLNGKGLAASYIYHRTNNGSAWSAPSVLINGSYNTNRQFLGVATCDLDGDGNQDLFYTVWDGPGNASYVYHMERDGIDGVWGAPVQIIIWFGRVFSDVSLGDTDADGKVELLYSASITGQGYSYMFSQEWNGVSFDPPSELFYDTNGFRDFDGVAMVHNSTTTPLPLGTILMVR